MNDTMQHTEQPIPKGDPQDWTMAQLENFGRIRLSRHFFMREMLYSEVASVLGIRNVPDNPALAIEVGKALCATLLEPLHAAFGHVTVRSAFRSTALHERGGNFVNIDGSDWNRARHTWDRLDAKGNKGATVSVVIPWFVDYLQERPDMSWKAMAWWIHDHLDYSEVTFFHNRNPLFEYAAFNIRWHETERRRWIKSTVHGVLTGRRKPGHASRDHASEYPGFPKLER